MLGHLSRLVEGVPRQGLHGRDARRVFRYGEAAIHCRTTGTGLVKAALFEYDFLLG